MITVLRELTTSLNSQVCPIRLRIIQSYFPRFKSSLYLQQRNLKRRNVAKHRYYRLSLYNFCNTWADGRRMGISQRASFNPDTKYENIPPDEHDGLLATVIRELRFSADLIVLSACNTAAGYSFFDSVILRAFIFAGAKAVGKSLECGQQHN